LRIRGSQCILEEYSISHLIVNMDYLWQIKDWLKDKAGSILASSAFVLMAGLSFVGGTLFQKDQNEPSAPLVINIPDYEARTAEVLKTEQGTPEPTSQANLDPVANTVVETTPLKEESLSKCPYVGSKNSDKYHLASCGVVKRIKPENRRCFASPQVAEASGYQAGCLK
jgi:hypothetical protein